MMLNYTFIQNFLGAGVGDFFRLNLPCQHCIQGWISCQDQWRDIHRQGLLPSCLQQTTKKKLFRKVEDALCYYMPERIENIRLRQDRPLLLEFPFSHFPTSQRKGERVLAREWEYYVKEWLWDLFLLATAEVCLFLREKKFHAVNYKSHDPCCLQTRHN